MSDNLNMTAPGAGAGYNGDIFDRLLRERIIFLGSQVDDEIANKLCAQILLLSAEGHLAVHQLPRWFCHRRHGHLRHDEVLPV